MSLLMFLSPGPGRARSGKRSRMLSFVRSLSSFPISRLGRLCRVALLPCLALAGTAPAHHSYAMFDLTREVTLNGAVKAWERTNPHSRLVLLTTDAGGKVTEWGLEGSSPSVLRSRGWNRMMVKPGDKIVAVIRPLRNGANGGQLERVTAADGQVYAISTPPSR